TRHIGKDRHGADSSKRPTDEEELFHRVSPIASTPAKRADHRAPSRGKQTARKSLPRDLQIPSKEFA
ncbi:MAG: hypothetical protein AAFY66_08045, partial [Pseudomonadota bacterium]